jgi:hypothetical protein
MSFLGNVWDKTTDVLHAVTGIPTADQKRNASKLVNDQIRAYKEMSEISKNELASKKNEELAEKRKIEEKQIRSLRRNYRPQGIMSASSPTEQDMSTKLGG